MRFLCTIFLLCSLLAVSPGAQAEDEGLTRLAADAVAKYPRYTVFDDISLRVEAGVVQVAGKVTEPLKKEEIGRRIAAIAGVLRVKNEIQVLPVSIRDDHIRRRIARSIYAHPTFWRFAAMPNPPIHIVVEHGHVTLTGIVPSGVDRALAHSLAIGNGELSVVNNLRTEHQNRE